GIARAIPFFDLCEEWSCIWPGFCAKSEPAELIGLPRVFDQVAAVDTQVIQHDGPSPFINRIHSPKLDPGEFNDVHALAWPPGRSAGFGSHPGKKLPV